MQLELHTSGDIEVRARYEEPEMDWQKARVDSWRVKGGQEWVCWQSISYRVI